MQPHVSATRMALLATRLQIGLARQGRDLLKEKRNALMKVLMQVADTVFRESDALEAAASQAGQALALASAMDGPEVVQSAGFAAQSQVALIVEGSYVMGVPVPRIQSAAGVRNPQTRGYSPTGASAYIDEAAARFEREVALIIDLAAREALLRRLTVEIARTSRRVNALEHVRLPALVAQRRQIQLVLEEREREDRFRMKRVKQRLKAKRHDGRATPFPA